MVLGSVCGQQLVVAFFFYQFSKDSCHYQLYKLLDGFNILRNWKMHGPVGSLHLHILSSVFFLCF